MKKLISLFIGIICAIYLSGCISSGKRQPQSELSYQVHKLNYDTKALTVNSVDLRTAVFQEANGTEFKGCVIYLQGLADSIMNQAPLFSKLSEGGYRVIAFDYMGQGGSEGSMNHTRLYDKLFRGLEIGNQAKFVWDYYSNLKLENGKSCADSKKMVMGWSTGGLAAYRLAEEAWASGVVLIAPGIHPNTLVGEAAESPELLALLKPIITERTLTRNRFLGETNPHVDPIKPNSPALVPLFSTNLIATAKLSQHWRIPTNVRGLVFVGTGDTYVDYKKTQSTLKEKAAHFSVVTYEGALHEIQNEVPDVSEDLAAKAVGFFDQLN